MAATVLQPGDIAIVGYTTGNPSTFSFVNLVPLAPETIIYFTDTGWNAAGNVFRGIDENTPFGSEGLLKFVVKSRLAAGTVIRSNDAETATWKWENSDGFSQIYSFTNGRNGPEDQLLAFQSTNAQNPLRSDAVTPLFQIDNTARFEDAVNLNTGNIFHPLSEGSTAVRFSRTESRAAFKLDVLSSGTPSEWLTAIANSSNWNFENTNTPLPNESISVSLAELSFSASTFQVREDGSAIAAVTIVRGGDLGKAVSAQIRLTDGSAVAPADYMNALVTVELAANERSKIVTIPIFDDTTIESDEILTLTLQTPSMGATIGSQNTATLTIVDEDVQLNFSAPTFQVREDGTAIAAVTVTRTGRSTGTVGATISLSNGTAIAPGDYTSTPINVILGNGEMSKTVSVPIVNDTLVESNETINLVLSNATGGASIGTQNTATLTIVEDDVQLAFSAPSFSVSEDGTPITAVTVSRTGRSTGTVGATISLSNGTAIAPGDYTSTPISVVLGNGERSKVVTIPIANDTLIESAETINLALTSPTGGATIGTQNTATLTIGDDDVQLAFSAPSFRVNENGTPISAVTVTRTGRTSGTVGATVTLSNGTAIAPGDYNNASINVVFASGETSKTVTIPTFNDTAIEADEDINLVLTTPTGGATIGAQNTAKVSILDDDVQIAFSQAAFSVLENGTPITAVTLTRTGRTSGVIGATIALNNDTAVAPGDYSSTPINVVFASEETTKTITIRPEPDTMIEGNETIGLSLTAPTGGATIGAQSAATLTIIDDDVHLAFSAPSFSVVEDGTPIATVTVTRTGLSSGAVSAFVELTNWTAIAGSDYYNNGLIPVHFGPDDVIPKTVLISVENDTLQEADETINLRLVNPTNGATIGAQGTASLTIINNDFIGGAQNDALWGGPYNDYLAGNDGNDRIIGREGNDQLLGNTGDDDLIGVAPGSATPGRGEIDRLVGGVGGDRFHLGSATAFYYNDGNGATNGTQDYAQIVGFNTNVDSIVLRGSASRYQLRNAPAGLPSGTAIYLLTSGQVDELIGIVEGVSPLRISDRYFSFV